MSEIDKERASEKLQRTLPSTGRDQKPPTPEQARRAADLESRLGRMRGVRQARVRPLQDRLEAVVLTLPERCEDNTESDVRAVATRIGIEPHAVDVRVLGARGHGTLSPRRKLSSLSTKRYGERFTAQVTLELDGDALVGEVDVPVGRRFEYRSVARAILESVQRLIPYALQLENVDVLGFGAERLAVVSVSSKDDLLVGSALVRGDELDAIARATLDAMNRVINLGVLDLQRRHVEEASV